MFQKKEANKIKLYLIMYNRCCNSVAIHAHASQYTFYNVYWDVNTDVKMKNGEVLNPFAKTVTAKVPP